MLKKIKPNIWQLCFREFGSCVYLVKLRENNILIDTGSSSNRDELIKDLKKLNTNPSEINILILTHAHYDHTDNIGLFENAKIYGSRIDFQDKEIIDIDKLNIREFEIIGEETGKLSDSLKQRYPNIEWQDIKDFRNLLIHEYFGVDLEIVWKIISDDLPDLLNVVREIMQNEIGEHE